LKVKIRELAGIWRGFQEHKRQNSLQFRLCGGARSLALTFLCLNSLLTGKNTGNLRDFALENRTLGSLNRSFQ